MQTISQVVEGHVLGQVISLPKELQDSKVRITIAPIAKSVPKKTTRAMLRESLKGSHTEALTGVIKNAENIDLKKMQEERRSMKYECTH